ncbi:uncharacterized protein METZ01_LOCUS445678, partial [marine metagenome]
MLKTIKKLAGLVLKNSSLLLILFVLLYNSSLRAEENGNKFVGFIESLEGEINKKEKEEIIKLNEF